MRRRGIGIIIIIAVAVCVIAACVLFLTGVIRFPGKQEEEAQKPAEMYIEYMNAYMLVDSEGRVIGSTAEKPTDIPEVNGISFSNIVVGEELVPSNENEYEYARKVVTALRRNDLFVEEVYISSEQEAFLYFNEVRVLLGTDRQTEDKLKELRDFYDDVKNESGTLDMQELSHSNSGYTLRPNK